MKAIIHIGMPKAGSSTLQAFLQMNRAALSRQGVLYHRMHPRFGSQFELPVTALGLSGQMIQPVFERNLLGLHSVGDLQAYARRYARHLDNVLAAEADHGMFIASSEHIYPWLDNTDQVAALDRFLSRRFSDIRYLVYLRSQEQLVLSGYSEAIRRIHAHSLEDHVRTGGKINLFRPVDRWVRALGPARVTVRLMSPDALKDGDLLADFCHVTGIDTAGLVQPGRVNTALSIEEIRIRRWLNRHVPRQNKAGETHLLYRAALGVCLTLARKRTPLALTDAQRAAIRQLNAPENERLRQAFFPDRPALF